MPVTKTIETDLAIWIYQEENLDWRMQQDPFVALAVIVDEAFDGQVLITSQYPDSDRERIVSILRIIRAHRNDLTIIVGTPHPTIELNKLFMENGASNVWATNTIYPAAAEDARIDLSEKIPLNRAICPALHLKKGDPIELSVCGKRNDRLILVMSTFKKWCLADYESCPYWRGLIK